MKFKTIA